MTMIKKTEYYCCLCNNEYVEGEEACGCEKNVLYACPICKDTYDSETSADWCCEQFEESEIYECESCGERYTDDIECGCEDEE